MTDSSALFELTHQLINIDSVTGKEREVGLFLRELLARDGFEVQVFPVDKDRFNILATWGKPHVVLSSHIDTVPPFFGSSETPEYIFGRGACDTKGIIAAMIFALRELKRTGLSDFALLLVTGEENGSDGARSVNALAPPSVKYLINGEPTENRLAAGSKGALRVELSATGKSAHSAYPEKGDSAIEKLLDILNEIRALPLPEHPVLGRATCNIGTISGGIQHNIIPDRARAELMLRTVTDNESVKTLIEGTLKNRGQLRTVFEVDPVLLKTLSGFAHGVMSFTTDIPLLSNWGTPFLLGPGSILDAHSENERISKAQLTEAVDLYVKLVRQLLSNGPHYDEG